MQNKLLIGITGGIGSGKTTASKYFEQLGYKVVYADSAAKELYSTNNGLKRKLVGEFGKGILDENENISGIAARRIILSSRDSIERVNSIVHPFVVKEIDRIISKISDRIVFVEAAIMFDSGYYKKMDYTLLIYAKKSLRVKRVMERDMISSAEVEKLMQLQMDEREKMKLADFVIKNDDTKEKFLKALKSFSQLVKNL